MPFDLSHLDTSTGALIRSGAALLGIVLGAFVLAAKPRSRFTRLFGTLLVLDGAGYAMFALAGGYVGFPHEELVVPGHLVFVPIVFVAAGLLLAAFWPDVRGLAGHRVRFASGLGAAAPLVLLTTMAFVLLGPPSVDDYGSELGVVLGMADSLGYSAYLAVLTVVGAALLARVRRNPADPRARAFLLVGGYAIANAVIQAGNYIAEAAGESYPIPLVVMLLGASAAVVQMPFAFLGLGPVGGWSRWVPIVLMFACLATASIETWAEIYLVRDVGFGGVVSLAGLLGVGYAIFRLDLLGAVVPRPKAGLLAAIGLAALFITAQVGQNFLSDELGLLAGGIVAGAAVFAVYPIQRAAERTLERDVKRGPAAEYRTLVEHAWSDGHFGPKERLMLSETRRRLRLGAEAAQAIEDDVARGVRRGD